jgi:cytidylate kinase
MGEKKPVVMDGRDIGTNVFRQARFKFFMTASPEERARRRHKELGEDGQDIPFSQVLSDINRRDYDDSHRALNPLTQAEDAILIDTDGLSADEVSALILKYVISNTQVSTR